MIKLTGRGSIDERLSKVEQSINFSEAIYPFPAIGSAEAVTTVAVTFGGVAVDRSVFRKLLPDDRWVVYAAGFVDPADANGVTVSLIYQKDNVAGVTLGSATYTGGGFVKKALGPFDVFATAGVPAGETIPVIRLQAVKVTSGTATLTVWDVWLRLLSRRQ